MAKIFVRCGETAQNMSWIKMPLVRRNEREYDEN